MKLRQDERQWLIYQEDSVIAAIRALEVLGLGLAAPYLATHGLISLRALGNVAAKLARTRIQIMLSSDNPYMRVAGEHVGTIFRVLADNPPESSDESALDELHAALFWFDSILNTAGTNGPNWFQSLARGES